MEQRAPNGITTSLRSKVSPEEWAVRVDLAACYRLAVKYRMTDMIFTHISARVPGPDEHFLINPYGLIWEEVNASSLVKVDLHGNILQDTVGLGINPAGYIIHSAIHEARHDVKAVMHTHTRAGVAVSAQKQGLLPLSQHAMRFYGRVAYHDYEGVVLDADEKVRLVANLGTQDSIILRNHGLLTCGATVREAFDLMYYLELACQIQIDALAGGAEPNLPPPGAAQKAAAQFVRPGRSDDMRAWNALLRSLDRDDPSFRD
jgi:ribulose-5-phosphate 4-epimerase/fuculose-1-phosphate aldolase